MYEWEGQKEFGVECERGGEYLVVFGYCWPGERPETYIMVMEDMREPVLPRPRVVRE